MSWSTTALPKQQPVIRIRFAPLQKLYNLREAEFKVVWLDASNVMRGG